MKRSISSMALLFTSVSAILGSGWLFSSFYAAQLAGPGSVIAWILAGVGVIVIAFVFAELCTLFPVTGSSTRIPHYTHGTMVSFLFSWVIWLSYASLAPTEVQAVIQYWSYFSPGLVDAKGGLTSMGYLMATILMLAISALNIFSLRWLVRANNVLTVMKLVIPIVISVAVLAVCWHPHAAAAASSVHQTFLPFGWHGVFAAMSTGGIVFAFNGFKQACEMAGEAKNPSFALPFAVIGSVVVCLLIYLLLQVSFLSSLTPQNLAQGWAHLQLSGDSSPLTAILKQNHLSSWLGLLYVGAVIGPLAAGLMYVGSASRSLYGMSKNDQVPAFFRTLTTQGNPMFAICANFALGMFMFAPLPGWNNMVTFLTSLMALTYGVGPVCLLTLRHQLPARRRPFRLPLVNLWTGLAFYICTLLAYWSGWAVLSKLALAMLLGLVILFVHRFLLTTHRSHSMDWRASIWVWPYFVGLIMFSYLGSFGGGRGVIPFGWDLLGIAIFCAGVLWLAVRFHLTAEQAAVYCEELEVVA